MESRLISHAAAIVESGLDVDPDSEIAKIKEEEIRPKNTGELREMVLADMLDTFDALVLAFGEEKAAEYYDRIKTQDLGMDGEMPEDYGPTDTPSAMDVKAAAEDVASKTLTGIQTTSLIGVIEKYAAGALTLQQAINIVSVSIGVTKEEARKLVEGLA